MMIEPPIDELTKKANGNKYILSIIASKRAKEIETTRRAELATADKKSISIALDEIYEGKIVPSDVNDWFRQNFCDIILLLKDGRIIFLENKFVCKNHNWPRCKSSWQSFWI